MNVPTRTVPSATAAFSGCSWGTVLTAHAVGPGAVVDASGGAIVTVATASASGNNRMTAGSTVIQRGGVTERFERELVDDVAGVANAELGRDRRAGRDG